MRTLKSSQMLSHPALFATALVASLLASSPTWAQQDSEIGPEFADAPETVLNPAVPQGMVYESVFKSADSKI